MNKTVTTNIGGFIFHIDENAYDKLSQYLNTIKGYFKASEGRDEIIGDIEARIAEMFREKTGNTKEVINMKDVDEVIAVMGQPEAFADSGDAAGEYTESTTSSAEATASRKRTRRIFRDPDDKIVGGVCSGISAYFDIDPIWMRLTFAVSFFVFGSGFLLYLILMIIIPKAKTTAEKLEMRGESVNVHNIEKTIREEMDELKQRFNNLSGEAKEFTGRDGKVRTAVHDFFQFLGSFFRLLFKAIGKIFGAFFLIIGLLLLSVTIASLMGLPAYVTVSDLGAETRLSLNEIMYHFLGTRQLNTWATISAALLICIPLLALVFAGVKIVFNIKKPNRYFGWIMSGLWTTGLIISIIVIAQVFKDFKTTGRQKDYYTITKPKTSEVLYLNLNNNFQELEEQSAEVGDWNLYIDDEESQLFKRLELDIEKSTTDSIELEVSLYSQGPSRKDAISRAGRIIYTHEAKDSILMFDKYMYLERGDKWRFQNAKLVLRIPVGQTIYLNENMESIIFDIGNVTNTYYSDMVNRRWKMTQNGLACVDCDNLRNIVNDEWETETPELETPEAPEPPAPPAKPKKQKQKEEASLQDSGITREQFELLSKLNRMYLELKYPDTNLVL